MADLLSLLPAGGASGEFLASSTRSFLRRFSSTPGGTLHNRSRSADPTQLIARSKQIAEHLSRLRREIEGKTECLNDADFEVTEEWLFEFANQHLIYMEKATSRTNAHHEFRSTTDLFQHVLQHPKVQKLMEGRDAIDWEAAANVKSSTTTSATPNVKSSNTPWSPASTDVPTSPEYSPGHAALSAETSPTVDDERSDGECLCAAGSPDAAKVDNKQTVESHPPTEKATQNAIQSTSGNVDSKFTTRCSVAAKAAPSFQPRLWLPDASALSQSSGGELMQKFKQRANSTGATRAQDHAQPRPSEAGELLKKLQQREQKGSSWRGLSPRSQRLAGKPQGGAESSEATAVGKLSERRKLLEGKLASCGFQKSAPSGGA